MGKYNWDGGVQEIERVDKFGAIVDCWVCELLFEQILMETHKSMVLRCSGL